MDAEYYQPEYFIDFSKGDWIPIGSMLKSCQYGISQAMTEEKLGFPIFRMNDIKNAFLVNEDVKYVNIPSSIFRQYKLQIGDVLFNRVNSEEFVGRTGIFKLNGDFVFASYLIRLKVKDKTNILSDYLNVFLNSSFGLKQIRKFRRRAVNQANVNAEELKQIKIAILPLAFQEKIQHLVNESWTNLELSKSLYHQVENLLLEELGLKDFQHKDDLSFVVNLSDVQSARRADAEFFQPKYQRLIEKISRHNGIKLGDLVTIKRGIEPGSEAYQENGRMFIRVSSLSKNGIEERDQKYLSQEMYQKLKNDYEPKVGEILLTKDASPGIAYVLKEPIDGIISGGILRLKAKADINAEYLVLCINSIIGKMQAERDAGGSIIIHWKPEQIRNVMIPVLPKPTQNKIAGLVHQSHDARRKSKTLLEQAKRAVEEMIESNRV